jgi:hypothetical protein
MSIIFAEESMGLSLTSVAPDSSQKFASKKRIFFLKCFKKEGENSRKI